MRLLRSEFAPRSTDRRGGAPCPRERSMTCCSPKRDGRRWRRICANNSSLRRPGRAQARNRRERQQCTKRGITKAGRQNLLSSTATMLCADSPAWYRRSVHCSGLCEACPAQKRKLVVRRRESLGCWTACLNSKARRRLGLEVSALMIAAPRKVNF